MATQVDDRDVRTEPGMGLALLTVLGMILTIAVLSGLIWAIMLGVVATTAGRSDQTAGQPAPLMDHKAQPANPPASPPSTPASPAVK
jgi:hypothetical protein